MPTLADQPSKLLVRSTRRYSRTLFSIPFCLHYLDVRGLRPIHAISLDISRGGVGALVQGKVRVGEAVQIDLPLGDRTLNPMAIVRYASDHRCGFEFLSLSDGDVRHLTRFVAAA